MKYIFFGTPDFAAIILEKLIKANFIPVAVITNPDRPVGRKKIITPSSVKQFLEAELPKEVQLPHIEILHPEKLDNSFIEKLKKLKPEFGVLAAYGKIIPKEAIDIFSKGIIVVHPSLLPKYRGSTPIQSVILADDKETGTTLFLMDEKVDHGPMIVNRELRIMNFDNYETLSLKLANLSANLLIKILLDYLRGKIKLIEQNHSQATYTKKITTEDGFVDLKKEKPEIIWRKVRALYPEQGVWTLRQAQGKLKRMKILEADLIDGKLILKKVQFEGKKTQTFPT